VENNLEQRRTSTSPLGVMTAGDGPSGKRQEFRSLTGDFVIRCSHVACNRRKSNQGVMTKIAACRYINKVMPGRTNPLGQFNVE